ncbi:DUF1800 domain-containing protein [Sphingomonas sp. LB-2]|uniref:DUF1800 domain-containing protein n=1 Tax=Sphingomonas caeni TaxID=2984949 RepID=UPI002230E1CE|nr:DUF1800 domain-containing protein [Sphingomonas caeni]MCW3846302.1 DUF1800 domain-containing protein [Sphingomonas caeni]
MAAITDAEAARFLLRAKFGATDADIAAVKAQGYAGWLDAQVKSARGQSGAAWLDSQGHNAITKEAEYFNPTAGDFMIWNQLLAQPDEMRQRCAFSLSQFFVVSLNPIDGYWPPYIMAAWWNILLDEAFGNFRTLLERVTLNAGMGMYLNTKGNLKEDPKTGRAPDENYAREIMQLFTIGLYQLNPDGTEKKDTAGKPIETYVQADVTSLANVFTGYDHDMSRVKFLRVAWQNFPVVTAEFTSDPMRLEAKNHSSREVNFLGLTIPKGTPAPDQLKLALDHLFAHPNVGPFFCRQMIQRMVTSNPSPAYVKRVADVFADNGQGVRGDLKSVWRAILLDPEALAPADPGDSMSGKLREPVQRILSWARTVGVDPGDGKYKIYNLSREDTGIGQSPLRSASVFNFFRPGYVPPHTAIAKAGKQAPEFQITNETSVAGYINFLQTALRFGNWQFKPTYLALKPIAHDPAAVVDWFNLHLTANQLSPATVTLIATALASKGITPAGDDKDKLDMIASACLLVMSAPEYLVQK